MNETEINLLLDGLASMSKAEQSDFIKWLEDQCYNDDSLRSLALKANRSLRNVGRAGAAILLFRLGVWLLKRDAKRKFSQS